MTLLAGGFPCQDLSQAGRTAGIEGAQSGIAGFSRVLALELAKYECTGNTISPGAATRLTIPLMEGRGEAVQDDDWTRGPA